MYGIVGTNEATNNGNKNNDDAGKKRFCRNVTAGGDDCPVAYARDTNDVYSRPAF